MTGLSLTSISKSFGSIQVLKNLNLQLKSGEVTAIVGDNGAGKSTLLKIMAGIHTPDEGTIRLGDHILNNCGAAERRLQGIEMVYQDLALAKQQDVVANLYLGREVKKTYLGFLNRKAMKLQATEDLNRLGMTISQLYAPVGLLSGGQQQAIAIARAVLFDPQVLLLDEPTAALAVREVKHVLDLIHLEKQRGRVVVLVSHRLNDVFAVSDRIVVMKQGCIAFDERASQISLNQIVEKIVS